MIGKLPLTFAALLLAVSLCGCASSESNTIGGDEAGRASFVSEGAVTLGKEETIPIGSDDLEGATVQFEQDDNPGYALVLISCALNDALENDKPASVTTQGDDVFVQAQDGAALSSETTLLDKTVGTALESNNEEGIEQFSLVIKVAVADEDAADLAEGSQSANAALISSARDALAASTLTLTADDGEATYIFEE